MAHCRQIGEGGAMVFAGSDLSHIKEGDTLATTFFLPNIGGIACRALCLYRHENGLLGVEFDDLDAQQKKRLRNFVAFR